MSAQNARPMAHRAHYLSDLLHNGLSVAARLLAGVGVFVVLARWMGPADFGEFMFKMAAASLTAYITVLGFTPMTLREVPAKPEQSTSFINAVATCKMHLAAAVLLVSALAASVFHVGDLVFLLLLAALILDGGIEWLFALQKARGRYDKEASFMSVAAVGHALIVLGAAWHWHEAHAVAGAFVVSKALQFIAAAVSTHTCVSLPRLRAPWRDQRTLLLQSRAYSLDAGLSVVTSQFDTVLVRVLYGAHTAGLYQAAMRVVIGLQSFSAVVGNVFLPRLSSALKDPTAHDRAVSQLMRVYGGLTAGLTVGVLVIGQLLTRYGYGQAFQGLDALWPFLAALMAIRTWSAVYGVQLTAGGFQGFRTRANLTALLVMVGGLALGAWAAKGLLVVVGSLLLSALFIFLVYRRKIVVLRRDGERL